MKKSFSILFACLLIAATTAPAQDYAFKVLVNKGNNEVKAGSSWQPIKTGATLKPTDVVKLTNNAYLGLIHSSGKPLEIKQPGTYVVTDLSAKLGSGSSVLNKYTDFMLSSNKETKNRLSATGAVHRGGATTTIYLPKPEHAIVFGNSMTLDWEHEAAVTTYVVNLKSLFGDELYTTETSAPTVTINLDDAKFKNEDNIIVEIYPKGQSNKKPDPPFMVKKLSAADKDRIKSLLSEISDQTGENVALNKYILASFYEQNKLYIDASSAFLDAIRMAPDVEVYKEDYNNFLMRTGMKEEKK